MNYLRTVLTAVLLCTCNLVHAQAAMEFRDMPIARLIQVVYSDIVKKPYIIDDRVTGTVAYFSIPGGSADIQPILDEYLLSRGIQRVETGGLSFFKPHDGLPVMQGLPVSQLQPEMVQPVPPMFPGAISPDMEVVVYRPKYRPIEFLRTVIQLAGGVVQSDAMTTNRENTDMRDVLVYAVKPDKRDRIAALLDDVDRSVGSVVIRAVLLEVTTSNDAERSLSLLATLFSQKLGITYIAGAKQANAISFKNANLNMLLSVIDGDSRFKYLAEPHLRVVDGETAKLTVGADVPTRGEVSYDQNGNPSQSIIYRTAGVVISVRPRILENTIQLKINQQISNFTNTSTSEIDSPSILRREVDTTVDTVPGELIVLAGLDETKETDSRSGLFFMPDFLKSSSSSKSNSQVVLLLEVEKH